MWTFHCLHFNLCMYKNAKYIFILIYKIKIIFITWTTGLCKWAAKDKRKEKLQEMVNMLSFIHWYILQPICKYKNAAYNIKIIYIYFFYDLCHLFYYFDNNNINIIKIVIITFINNRTIKVNWKKSKKKLKEEVVTSNIP